MSNAIPHWCELLTFIALAAVICQQTQLNKIKKVMSKFSDQAASIFQALDQANTDFGGIKDNIAKLTAQISALQNTPGTLSDSDQQALDNIQNLANSIRSQADQLVIPTQSTLPPEGSTTPPADTPPPADSSTSSGVTPVTTPDSNSGSTTAEPAPASES